jgi:TonB C terminal
MKLNRLAYLLTNVLLLIGFVGQVQATIWHDPWKKKRPTSQGQRYFKDNPILKDDKAVMPFDPTGRYIEQITTRLKKGWMPPSAKADMNCAAVTLFDVNAMGNMLDAKVLSSSCNQPMIDSVWATLRANEQLPKPSVWVRTPVRVELTFAYVAKR